MGIQSQSSFPNFDAEIRQLTKFIDNLLIPVTDTSFPPYGLIQDDEHNFRLEFAVAGFSEKELSVVVEDGVLIVSGEKSKDTAVEGSVIRSRIARRPFSRKFKLEDNANVSSATYVDGILTIQITITPPVKNTRKIDITVD